MNYACVVPMLLLLAGCRSGDPLIHWQRTVEQYVNISGAGDLAALRDAGDSRAADELRPALAAVSVREIWATDANPPGYRDAHGVLVGLAGTDSHPWYVFAVGICEPPPPGDQSAPVRQRIADVRIAAISGGPERFVWQTAPADAAQLSRYLSANSPEWPAMDVRWPFPRAVDDFTLETGDTRVRVIERHSGAKWTLSLTE